MIQREYMDLQNKNRRCEGKDKRQKIKVKKEDPYSSDFQLRSSDFGLYDTLN